MKRELGIARCGLACCLCSVNKQCAGCESGACPDKSWCKNRQCSIDSKLKGCYECRFCCDENKPDKIKRFAFTQFIKRYGMERLLDCLEKNEQNGVVYHRNGIKGDYDAFDDAEALIDFIKNGKQ